MQIGNYKLVTIHSGFIGLDGGAMFGIIPKPLWEKTNPADNSNRVTLATRNLLLVSESRKILIDTGMGNKWDDKAKNIYRIDENLSLEKALGQKGFSFSDITDVILTHLHFDHAGGSTKFENNQIVPSFPNAKYHIQKENFDWAMNPSDRDRGSYIKENFEPLAKEGVLKLLTSNEFDENISFEIINGHTFGQQMVKISDGNQTVLYCADLLPFVSHIRLPYIMAYDLQPLITLAEKKKYLKQALDENWILFFGHDPDYAAVTLKRGDKGISPDKTYFDLI